MSSINVFVGVGRIVRDVAAEQTKGGLTKATFTLAMETKWKGKDGEKKEVCFIDCTVWNDEALRAATLKKGNEVFVKGRLKLDKWPDPKSGIERQKHVIVADTFMHSAKLDSQLMDVSQMFEPTQKVSTKPQAPAYEDEFGDLPF